MITAIVVLLLLALLALARWYYLEECAAKARWLDHVREMEKRDERTEGVPENANAAERAWIEKRRRS